MLVSEGWKRQWSQGKGKDLLVASEREKWSIRTELGGIGDRVSSSSIMHELQLQRSQRVNDWKWAVSVSIQAYKEFLRILSQLSTTL